ncbi:flagellin [Methylobacterium aerolatum]|uniref:Flagellin n=1 Tax=Methylobacterium aerolatum TaxID=418708 RepID=A0ABU0I1U7_9HYPH|nr:flagellin [Methylobacterium aerolatum]MDQ0447686.1 hypothetical protein [Methylobacterium aerolatum]GJD34786.1 hypothetical protein FMGBMHLM_1689 [Methylobacterium aerolatum]
MTTIAPFAAGSYATSRSTSQLLALKSQLNDLTTQLGTGLTAQSYGGLGTGRSAALSAQASISALDGYSAVIDTAQTRAKLATTSMTQVVTVASNAAAALQNGLQSSPAGSQAVKATALNNFSAAIDALNQSDGIIFLFGGRDGTTAPVLDTNTILYGTVDANGNTLAGLKTLVDDQVKADLGTGLNGRLTQTTTGTAVTLTEDTTAQAVSPAGPFGFTIQSVGSSNPAALAPVTNLAAPASSTVTVAAQPSDGDTLTFTLGMPGGGSTTVTLTASKSTGAVASGTFSIGADVATTTANLSAALSSALQNTAAPALSANATARASQNFFTGSAKGNVVPERITFTGSVPSYTPGTATNTVLWYRGDDSGGDPRATQTIQVGSSSSVQLGVRANEAPIRSVLAGLATVALGIPANSATSSAYAAVAAQAAPLLAAGNTGSSVQDIVTDLSLASARMSSAASTNTSQKSTLQDTVDGIEQASTEEVATKLLELQNRLQASYQITASLSKLSLTNYLS